jgi:peptidyl-prolyl cis-trans isomerase C
MQPERRIVGVDPNERRVALARHVASRLGLAGHRFVTGDARSVPLEAHFAGAYVLDVMHHIPREQQEELLARLRDLLAPRGVLIIKDITTEPMRGLLFTEFLDRLVVGWKEPLAYRHHSEWRDILTKLGFHVRVIRVLTGAYNSEAAAKQGGFTESETSATVTARLVAAENATATAAEFTPTPTLTTTVETTTAVSPTATAAPTPTINTITGDSLTEAVTSFEQEATDAANLTPDELREIVRRRLLKDKVAEVIGEEAETTALQTNARHILVRTAETDDEETVQQRLELAEEIRAKWVDGQSYEDLKAEYEDDPEGNVVAQDLGWFTQEAMVAEFAEAAFSQEVGTISEPVKTQFGWHLIEVLEREERPLEGFALDQVRSDAYNNWLIQARSGDIENLWTPDSPPPDFGS